MRIEKAKLPKGMSYPVKSSELEAALLSGGITLDTSISYSIGPRFFDAHLLLPNENVPHERLMIRVWSVSATVAQDARDFMSANVIPEMVAWVKGILALPSNSPVRRDNQQFHRPFPCERPET